MKKRILKVITPIKYVGNCHDDSNDGGDDMK